MNRASKAFFAVTVVATLCACSAPNPQSGYCAGCPSVPGGSVADGGAASPEAGAGAPQGAPQEQDASPVQEEAGASQVPLPSTYDVAKTLAGAYAGMIKFRKVVTVGTFGSINALAAMYAALSVTDDATHQALALSVSPCHIDLSGNGTGLLNGAVLQIPDVVMTTTHLDPAVLSATSDGGAVTWGTAEIHGPIGWKWTSPSDALPTTASDPRVFDQDGDGHPGVTMNIPYGGTTSKEYFVQLERDVLKGTVAANGDLVGTTTDTSELNALGSDNNLIAAVTVTWTADSNTADDTVRLVRVPMPLACQDLMAQAKTLFP